MYQLRLLTPWSLKQRPHALQTGSPWAFLLHSVVVLVWQLAQIIPVLRFPLCKDDDDDDSDDGGKDDDSGNNDDDDGEVGDFYHDRDKRLSPASLKNWIQLAPLSHHHDDKEYSCDGYGGDNDGNGGDDDGYDDGDDGDVGDDCDGYVDGDCDEG